MQQLGYGNLRFVLHLRQGHYEQVSEHLEHFNARLTLTVGEHEALQDQKKVELRVPVLVLDCQENGWQTLNESFESKVARFGLNLLQHRKQPEAFLADGNHNFEPFEVAEVVFEEAN